MSDLTTDDLRRMSASEVAKLDPADVDRALNGPRSAPATVDELRALSPAEVRKLDPADVNRLLAGEES